MSMPYIALWKKAGASLKKGKMYGENVTYTSVTRGKTMRCALRSKLPQACEKNTDLFFVAAGEALYFRPEKPGRFGKKGARKKAGPDVKPR